MRLKHWLLTGTSLGLLALFPLPAAAQEAACLEVGIESPEDCAAYLGGAVEEPAYEEPAVEEPVYEEPAPEEQVFEEPAYEEPVEEPVYEEPVIEEPVYEEPEVEEQVFEEPAPEEEIFEEEPAIEEEVFEEPQAEEEIVEEEPVAEEEVFEEEPAAEEELIEEEPAAEEELIEEEPAPADETLEEPAEDSLDALPAEESSIEELPAEDETVTEEPTEDQAAEDASLDTVPEEDPFAQVEAEPLDEATEMIEGVEPEESAPLLDSSKEAGGDESAAPVPEEDLGPPPTNDAEAQVTLEVAPEEIIAADDAVAGERLAAAPELAAPQNVTIINQTNNTYIYQVNNQVVINNVSAERERIFGDDGDYYYEQVGRNRYREVVERRDGTRIVTIRNRYGDILERYRVDPRGRRYVLAYFEDRYYDDLDDWRDPGLDLPPLRLTISFRDYVLDWQYADEDEIYTFFEQPPVERVRRLYSIGEIKRSARLRDSVRRLEVADLNFPSGSADLPRKQIRALEKLARAIQNLLEDNPAETFLIEGHTDATGSDEANLLLSDRRAATVARILTQYYDIPPENLVTQGYGERYLRVKTQGSEPRNRRVVVRRITPLITPVASR